ncbi:MAG: class I SAM-dependent methyltransferase [Woeseiaceae bacterium]|nr:class I SAM-dependent methyltransferase [Woeseiaceae bacterium]
MRTETPVIAAYWLLLLPLAGVAQEAAVGEIEPDVPYVPTPYRVVEAMLDVADVGPDDVVYDLGSGDGRIVIAAARDRGAKGIGVEIDPQYIQMARLNARADGVNDKVTFVQDDLFEMDFSDATVVALYLSEPLNIRLRPMLFEQLRPGVRIVSHEFGMGDWEPEQTLNIGGHIVHYWVVPDREPGPGD